MAAIPTRAHKKRVSTRFYEWKPLFPPSCVRSRNILHDLDEFKHPLDTKKLSNSRRFLTKLLGVKPGA
ncbi:hypothetical protein, partial [Cohnella endophytica]|uniref:hypothetical protein n=1 Tax=Cohnella endophytica TaxID=2419778 RepID=UPI001F1B93F5